MEKNNLLEQCRELRQAYPQLSVEEFEQEIIMKGMLEFNAEYKDIPINDKYNIKMCITTNFPKHMPSVWEIDNRVPKKFEHFMEDDSLCLGTQTEIALKLSQNPTLKFFVDNFVINYLYAASYYEKYGIMPFGERAHGDEGIVDFYKELFSVDCEEKAFGLLQVISLDKYRGHQPCPCGSGKNMRSCEHKEIMLYMINSDIKRYIQYDYLCLIKKERGKYGKMRTSS